MTTDYHFILTLRVTNYFIVLNFSNHQIVGNLSIAAATFSVFIATGREFKSRYGELDDNSQQVSW